MAQQPVAVDMDPVKSLRISRVEVIPVRVPLPRVFEGSNYFMTNRCTVVTRVYTDDGVVGEAYNGDADEEQAAVASIITDEIAPLLVNSSAFSVEACWQAMLPCTYNILRNRSLALQAMACVDTAIWDAVGKALQVPLYRLWGGYRESLPVIAIGGYYGTSDAEIAREMERYRELGFAGCKFKVGRLSPEEDAHRIRVAREAVGNDFILMADANQGYTRDDALRFVRLTEDVGLRWFEEPCRWYNDRLAMRDVRLITGVPVVAGQSESSRVGVRDLLMAGAIDACNCDASWIGGPTEWRRIASMALAWGVDMAHHEEPQVSSHLLASVPHGTYVEGFDPDRDPIFWQMIANRPPFQDGMMPLPQGPGLGWELDQAFIEKYRA